MTTDTRPPITFGRMIDPLAPRVCEGSGQRVAFPGLQRDDECPVCGETVAVDPDTDALIVHEWRDREAASLSFGL